MNAQKRCGFNKVPDFLQALMPPHKRMQRIAASKIQHAHSRRFRPRPVRCSADSRRFPTLSQVPLAPFGLRQPPQEEVS